jgi:sphinganine-1-phosphate aldolase
MTDPGELMIGLERQLKPYRGEYASFAELPADGLPRSEVAGLVESLARAEESRWRDGFASGAVYHGDSEHVEFLNRIYAAQSQSNALHPDLWPSAMKFESELISMTAHMLGSAQAGPEAPIVGTVSSGGTESILLAMKTYRDQARARRGIDRPQIVAPVTAHAAFDKASRYFDMPLVRVGVGADCAVDLDAMAAAVCDRTAVVVGSAPSFPHGVMDPIPGIAALAADRRVGCHVDACLGGRELRQFQYYTTADWPGGLYLSPTFAGSRSGALSATAWAAMVSIGEHGYTDAARRILQTGAKVRQGIAAIDGLRVLGDPLWVIAFAADTDPPAGPADPAGGPVAGPAGPARPVGLDVFQVLENMGKRGWSLNGLQRPAAVHIAITLRHTLAGVVDRFLADLRASVDEVRAHPEVRTGLAPIYGLAAALPEQVVRDLLTGYLDLMFEV